MMTIDVGYSELINEKWKNIVWNWSSRNLMACSGGGWSPDGGPLSVSKGLSPDLVTITMSSAGSCHVSLVHHCPHSFWVRGGIGGIAVGHGDRGGWGHDLCSGRDPSVTFQVA